MKSFPRSHCLQLLTPKTNHNASNLTILTSFSPTVDLPNMFHASVASSSNADTVVPMREWFARGRRVHYDPARKQIVRSKTTDTVDVFEHAVVPSSKTKATPDAPRWLTFLPGFPDGTYGFWKINRLLTQNSLLSALPGLFVEYVGQGDSDKPTKYNYSTMERADLVQAQWKAHGIRSTVIVTFDYSSLVLMELLQRQREGTLLTKIEHCLVINGGLFADGHTHPFNTTPLLQTRIGRMGSSMAQRSNFVFDRMLLPLFGKEYRASKLTKGELREMESAIRLHKGTSFLSNAAGFVDEHKQNADRWNLEKIYVHYAQYEGITLHLVGSVEDPFEHRQIDLAKQRLGSSYYPAVTIERIPGGHLSTAEQADRIVRMIELMARKPTPFPNNQKDGKTLRANVIGNTGMGLPTWTSL